MTNKSSLETAMGEAMAGNVRIAYRHSGTGPAFVCRHAFALDQSMWDVHRTRFSHTQQFITFDQQWA